MKIAWQNGNGFVSSLSEENTRGIAPCFLTRVQRIPHNNVHGCTIWLPKTEESNHRMTGIRKERRKSPRFTVAKSVLYNQANRLASAKTADIGSGGVRIVSDLPLRKGDVFEFLVILEGMGLKFRGRVIHTASVPDGRVVAGISFDEESSLSISLLDDYLKSHINTLPMAQGPLDLDQLPSPSTES